MTLGEPFKSTLTPFVPPEVYENRIHINSDIFSFGMIIVKIFEGEFDNLNKQARKNSDA
jgi:serine/threonine protein kinase